MTETYYTAEDGAKIAYEVTGSGEALLCVHGSGEDKSIWLKNGWVDDLKDDYTVITMDVRGFGNSTISGEKQFYSLENILGDIMGIVRACGFEEFFYLGHSYGATIGYQAINAGLPIRYAVLASGSRDDSFFKVKVPECIQEYEMICNAKRNGTIESLEGYSEEDMEWIRTENVDKFLAMFQSWNDFEEVPFEKLRNKVAMYSGSNDFNEEMRDLIQTESVNLHKNYGIEATVFDGLNHDELVTKEATCINWVKDNFKNTYTKYTIKAK